MGVNENRGHRDRQYWRITTIQSMAGFIETDAATIEFDESDESLSSDDNHSDDLQHHAAIPDQRGTFSPGTPNSKTIDFHLVFAEDHFSQPKTFQSLGELNAAINNMKQLVLSTGEGPEKRSLVASLVTLRLQREELKEEESDEHIVVQCGHHLRHKINKDLADQSSECEVCAANVVSLRTRGVLHCVNCFIVCHKNCLGILMRPCAAALRNDNSHPIISLTPQAGLSKQSFGCQECPIPLSHNPPSSMQSYQTPILCDYNGKFYCPACHWQDTATIPGRVVHNWDFEPRPVCRTSKHYLRLINSKPLFDMKGLNPALFSFVEELREVDDLRCDILLMKTYILSCPQALSMKLLRLLENRQHFIETSHLYSMEDLKDINADKLLPQLLKIHSTFLRHIKVECTVCKPKGLPCPACRAPDRVYSFDQLTKCPVCSSSFHKQCFTDPKHCVVCSGSAQ